MQRVSPSKLAAAIDAFFASSLGGLPETLAVARGTKASPRLSSAAYCRKRKSGTSFMS